MAKKATKETKKSTAKVEKKTSTKKASTKKVSTKKEKAGIDNSIDRSLMTFTPYPELNDMRLEQIRFMIDDQKLDAMIVTHMPTVRYLTKFSGSNGALLITPDDLHFFTDDRYEESVKTDLYDLPNMTVHITRDVWQYMVDAKILAKIKNLGFESDRIAYTEAVDIRNVIRPVKFKPAPKEVEPFTMPKAPVELDHIKAACKIAESVYETMKKKVKVGMTEIELQSELIYEARKQGSEGEPFNPIVLAGERTSMPHGRPSHRKIKKGDLILLDFGTMVEGFGCDITRVFCIGKPTKEQISVYKTVYEAKQKAIDNLRPGINGKILDEYARKHIEKAGYGDNFKHSLGHGIGVAAHEMPFITFRKEENVPVGVVLAIEPGIYFEGKWGIRLEDNVHVTFDGAVPFTNAPAELPVVK
ncbi:MAG: Xaa-Pro peptidase family protein [Candidatus Kapaibacterium sp.]|nr:aminopeptidase P family protein [Ignavibacteriota bacterium]